MTATTPAVDTGRAFISCDWGTSALRLRVVGADGRPVGATVESAEGIARTHAAWRASGGDRWAAFTAVLARHLGQLAPAPDAGLPLVVSGMASASIGACPLPYAELPFATDGRTAQVRRWAAEAGVGRQMLMISGVRSADDVMRGEETQLVGACALTGATEGLFILPGTHSKHVRVEDGMMRSFTTSMTGEFFELLSRHSVLSASVRAPTQPEAAGGREAFARGVERGAETPLLEACFRVRTREILGGAAPEENHAYLSGLLIGAELGGLRRNPAGVIHLIGSATLNALYTRALEALGLGGRVRALDGGDCLICGQSSILRTLP